MSLPRPLDPRLDRPLQPLPGGLGLGLLRGRVHELCGPSRQALAAMVMGLGEGPVIWAFPGWLPGRLFPDGLADFADPGRLILVRGKRPEDLLWTGEEALRSGAVPLVVLDLAAPPALTPVRRLTLAAEAGAEAARNHRRAAPLGLLLTPEEGGAAGADSRWRLAAAPSASTLLDGGQAWSLARLRARDAAPAGWHLQRAADGGMRLTPSS